jgi:hypothetical protein
VRGALFLGLVAGLGCQAQAVVFRGSTNITRPAPWENGVIVPIGAPPDLLWPRVCSSLSRTTDRLLEVSPQQRVVSLRLGNDQVRVELRPDPTTGSLLGVYSTRYMVVNPAFAEQVMARLLRDLGLDTP